ncbi:MAG TPA: response regulator [Vicinamibacterales bacterium]|nr:response regulator [Vicinamibacterales bacterium]
MFWLSAITGADADRRRPAILVADDDRDTRELYRAFFDLSGFVTAEASTGGEALALAERLLPDVLLTDLILPDIDGIAVARQLKQSPATAAIHVILLTGFSGNDLQRKAAEAGVARALLKPCLPDAMLREVRRTLRRPQA